MAARRPSRARDRFVAVSGAVVLALVVLGLVVVAQRGAPSEHGLAPEGVRVDSEGSVVVVTQGTEVEGVCVPPGSCATQTQVTWRLSGLPPAPGGTTYGAVLLRDGGPEPLGAFAQRDGRFVLEAQRDGGDARALRLVLSGGGADLMLHEVALAGGSTDLGGTFQASAVPGGTSEGRVRLEQIGAVSVSLLVDVEAAPVPDLPPGTVLRAWLQEDSGGGARYVYVGDLAVDGGRAVLDERHERVVRSEQDRFLVTLESGEVGDGPAGFPFFAADL